MSYRGRFLYGVALVIGLSHLPAAYAVYKIAAYGFSTFSTGAWWSLLLMWIITGLGVSVGYHRLLTHRSFYCSMVLKKVLYACAATTLQGTARAWAHTHIQHHACADKEGDPHRPSEFGGGIRGFLWSHMGWVFVTREIGPEEIARTKHLDEDPAVQWQRKYYLLFVLMSFLIPFAIAGWDGLLVGGFFRLVVFWHIIWGVNSVCHVIGHHARDHKGRKLNSRNARNFPFLLIMSILSWGEYWHANHHVRATSAYLGWRWYEIDFGKYLICLFERLGWAWNVQRPRFT